MTTPRGTTVAAAAAFVLASALLAFVLLGGGDDSSSEQTATAGGQDGVPQFELRHPSSWQRIDPPSVDGETADLALRRKDRRGLLTMSIRGPVRQGLASMEQELAAELRREVPGFRLVDSGRVQTPGGPALLFSWADRRSRRDHSTLLVPAGERSITLDAVTGVGEKKVADEITAMFATFDVEQPR